MSTTIFARRQRVRTLYRHSEHATIVGKEPAHVLDGRWFVVQWDDGGTTEPNIAHPEHNYRPEGASELMTVREWRSPTPMEELGTLERL